MDEPGQSTEQHEPDSIAFSNCLDSLVLKTRSLPILEKSKFNDDLIEAIILSDVSSFTIPTSIYSD